MTFRKFVAVCMVVFTLSCAMTVPVFAANEVVGQNELLLTAMNEPGARGGECTLGDATADAMRESFGTEIALLPGGVFAFNLLGGDITREDVYLIFPGEDMLGTAELTAAELWEVLEHSVSKFTVNESDCVDWENSLFDGFLQVSGLSFRFDASSLPGERVTEVTLDDGRTIDPADHETIITVVSTAEMLSGGYGYPTLDWRETDLTLPEMFIRYLATVDGALKAPELSRITMIGTADNAFLNNVKSDAVLFLACAGAIALVGFLTFGRSAAWKALRDRAMPETEEEKESALNKFTK